MKCSSIKFVIFHVIILIHESELLVKHAPIDRKITEHKNWKLLSDDCGSVKSKSRIVGGNKARIGQFPWIARLGYFQEDSVNYLCGGALMNEYFVLTVAHCVKHKEEDLVVVRLGENNIAASCENCPKIIQDRKPKNFIVHPEYNVMTSRNDIALIELDSAVTLSGYIQPICLPTEYLLVHDFVTEQTTVAGWGYFDPDIGVASKDLLFVELPIRDRCACNEYYHRQLVSSQLCVGLTTGKDSCNGDSGGPLMKEILWKGRLKTFVLGLVSFGGLHCGETPSVYTNVVYFMKWILDSLYVVKNEEEHSTEKINETSVKSSDICSEDASLKGLCGAAKKFHRSLRNFNLRSAIDGVVRMPGIRRAASFFRLI